MSAILGQLLAVLTAACFAAVSTVWSYVGKQIGSNTVTHIRLWLALPLIIVVHFFMTGVALPLHLDSTATVLFLISGLLGFTIADLFIFRSLVLIGVRETLVILTLAPILGTIISWFALGETLTYLQISGILVTTGGVMWVIYEEGKIRNKEKLNLGVSGGASPAGASAVGVSLGINQNKNLGVPFALAGALAQALANILSKAGMYSDIHPISGTFLRIIAGLAGLVVFSLLQKSFIDDFRKMRNLRLTAILAGAALVGPIMGVLLTLYALRIAPVGIVTALVQVSPILLLPFDYFVLKKKVTSRVVLGTFIAIGGAAILFIY